MEKFKKILTEWNINISEEQIDLFERYYDLLVSWNEKINLTSITGKEDVYIKHFADSISLLSKTDLSGKSLIDVGTGAGFPAVPIKIMCPDCKIVLADSLNKRISFLNELISELGLTDICAIHGRAEDLGSDRQYREKFDVAVSRAVANLSTLSEYCLPFVKKEGIFVSYKSGKVDDELPGVENAVKILGGKIKEVVKFSIPYTDYERSFVFISKIKETGKKYPRKAGTPSKDPL